VGIQNTAQKMSDRGGANGMYMDNSIVGVAGAQLVTTDDGCTYGIMCANRGQFKILFSPPAVDPVLHFSGLGGGGYDSATNGKTQLDRVRDSQSRCEDDLARPEEPATGGIESHRVGEQEPHDELQHDVEQLRGDRLRGLWVRPTLGNILRDHSSGRPQFEEQRESVRGWTFGGCVHHGGDHQFESEVGGRYDYIDDDHYCIAHDDTRDDITGNDRSLDDRSLDDRTVERLPVE